jgi:predicted hydrocarbon binding protein
VSAFFPARLGLSEVVEDQIRQFEKLARRGRAVDEGRAAALLELIVRRTDAAAVLAAAGEALAMMVYGRSSKLRRRLLARLPAPFRRREALRALRSSLQELLGAADVTLRRNPIEVRARDAITARVGAYGGACQLYSTTLSRFFDLWGVAESGVSHLSCQRHGDEACVWKME